MVSFDIRTVCVRFRYKYSRLYVNIIKILGEIKIFREDLIFKKKKKKQQIIARANLFFFYAKRTCFSERIPRDNTKYTEIIDTSCEIDINIGSVAVFL